jgi:hypothetical protein
MPRIRQWLDAKCVELNAWLDSPIAPPEERKHQCQCNGKCHKATAALTDEQQVIISAWVQFAYGDGSPSHMATKLHTGGLSALEEMEGYLQEHDLIDENGIPRRYQ